ncbi:hypothetical protein [Marinobacterium aestuariivivens]|uniref:Conjugative transfer protein 345 n=1 Tax=Marinobacterium aestuariivivens TaxID=1698799 RepID=A0ABW2A9B0_9GAMM
MEIKTIALAATIGTLGGAATSHFMLESRHSSLDSRLQKSPPVVVVDFAKMAMNYPEGASTEQVEELMMQTNNAVIKLREAGYLVLDAGAVVAAPEDLYLPEDLGR